MEYDRRRLLNLLIRLSLKRGEIVLSSGKESDFYIDCKKTTLTAEGHYLIGRLFLDAIKEHAPLAEGVGGLTLGADPIASAVSLTSYLLDEEPISAFIIRKEPKRHGTEQWIEGRSPFLPDGTLVVIVEDVVTTGASILKAIERAEAEGLKVVHTFVLVDRLEGGRETIESKGYGFTALYTKKDFV